MLKTLHKIVQEVSSSANLDIALQTIVQNVRSSMNVDVCSVYLTDENGDQVLMATEGLLKESVGRVRLSPGDGLIGLVAAQYKPVNLDDAPGHPAFHYFPEIGEEPYHAFLGVPAIHQRQLVGVLAVQQRSARRFSETHVAFMVTLAAQLAAIIAYDRVDSEQPLAFARPSKKKKRSLHGISSAPGIAIGQAVVIYPASQLKTIPDRKPTNIAGEEKRFHDAVRRARNDMQKASMRLRDILPRDELGLFDAYAMMIDDVELVEDVVRAIRSGNWAPGALRENIEKRARFFEQMDETYLRERAYDVRDMGQCILTYLQEQQENMLEYPPQTVLVGDQITAMDMADVPAGQLAGIVSGRGSSLSHVAILARSLNIPAVTGLENIPLSQLDGHSVVVDGYSGQVHDDPDPVMYEEYERLANEEKQLALQLEEFRDLTAETKDGWHISIDVNIGLFDGIAHAMQVGPDGVGLYRTELPFMVRQRFPTEDEQYEIYRHLLESFAPDWVTLRTLDVGGDKPLPYFPIMEDNPFLGWRGIRMSLDHPEILITQLRAALRASVGLDNLKLLFPMITTVNEVDEVLTLLRKVEGELENEGISTGNVPVGVMIEVPAAAYEAARIAQRVDFLSIGTNDLTQYMLAVDRANQRVARLFDSLHPAVLGLVRKVVNDGHSAGIPVGVCGEATGSPVAALPLLGMDVDWLSVSTADVPRLKWVVRSFTRTRLQQLLEQVLQLENTTDIRQLLEQTLEEAGLGGLARPGM